MPSVFVGVDDLYYLVIYVVINWKIGQFEKKNITYTNSNVH